MRRLLLWSAVAGFMGCLLRPTFATVIPSYGYVDGCTPVILQGHHLGEQGTARIGNAPILELEPARIDPKRKEHAQDVGFKYTGITGPAPGGKSGWYDVVMSVDGEDLTLRDGWYYRACPATFAVDAYTLGDADVGSSLYFEGCGLGGNVTVQFNEVLTGVPLGTADLQSDCSTAQVHADVPALPPGEYTVTLVATDGTTFPLLTCLAGSGDTAVTCVPETITVTAG